MSAPATDAAEPPAHDPGDFSLVLGGPLYQLWLRTRLAGDALQRLHLRVIVLAALAWVPLLLLSFAEGHVWGGSVDLPFFHDVEAHLRFLLSLPLLILAERIVHLRMQPVVAQFLKRDLIPDAARARYDAAIASAMHLRNSITAEVLLIAFVYVVGVGFIWRTQLALDVTSWYGVPVDGILQPSLAGWWLGCVSLPLYQFLLLRWYFRLFIWARFLWQVARIELRIVATHPDGCGGMSFLELVSYALAPFLLAQGVTLAGLVASQIFFAGATLPDLKLEIIGLVALLVSVILGPLLVFSPQLAAAKRRAMLEYGALAQRQVSDLEGRWVHGDAPAAMPVDGNVGGSFDTAKSMRPSPFGMRTVLQLGVVTLLPVFPLALTMISLEEFVGRLFKVIF